MNISGSSDLKTHVSKESQADVDEEVSTTSRDHENADWWDCELLANGPSYRVPKQAYSSLRTEDCDEDYKQGWDRFRHGEGDGTDNKSVRDSEVLFSDLLFVLRKKRKIKECRVRTTAFQVVMKAQLGACQVYRFQPRTDLGQALV